MKKPTKNEISKLMSYLGSKTSDAKTNAARLNAKKGGRPKGAKNKKKPRA